MVIYCNLHVERRWVSSALHYLSHQVNVRILGMLPGALDNNAAAQGEVVHALQLILHFLDRPRRADEGGWHSGVVREALHVLLSHGCRDPPTQRSDESASFPRESHDFLMSRHVTSTPILLLQPAYQL